MAEWSIWILAIGVNKYLLYLCIAASAGSVFMLNQTKDNRFKTWSWRYGLVGSVLGFLLAISDFFLQVGLFADAGWVGLVDSSYIQMMWESPLGTQLLYRLLGFVVLIAVLIWISRQEQMSKLLGGMALSALLLLGFASTQAGHTVEQSLWARLALGLHFLLGLWWIGCLWPLARSCQILSKTDLQVLMQGFGTIASVLVPILLLAGLGLAYALSGSLQHLLTSAHGQLLLIKIILVVGLLSLAAHHKLKLVPQLQNSQQAVILQRSIQRELVLGLVVLLVTAVLSSVLAPAALMNE